MLYKRPSPAKVSIEPIRGPLILSRILGGDRRSQAPQIKGLSRMNICLSCDGRTWHAQRKSGDRHQHVPANDNGPRRSTIITVLNRKTVQRQRGQQQMSKLMQSAPSADRTPRVHPRPVLSAQLCASLWTCRAAQRKWRCSDCATFRDKYSRMNGILGFAANWFCLAHGVAVRAPMARTHPCHCTDERRLHADQRTRGGIHGKRS
jgi:hypothetical protein